MHLRVILDTVTRLRQDEAFRDQVAADPDRALAALGLARDERQSLAVLSRQPDAVAILNQRLQW